MQNQAEEIPQVITCDDAHLIAIVHRPPEVTCTGVLIITGGPQYRVGSHRQFVQLARFLAREGVPAMRFDYRGMGDSDGVSAGFEYVDQDIRAAIDCMFSEVPGLTGVVLWGLCDAASAAMMYAHQDDRVSGMILLNPWVRTESGQAKALFRHYYLRRLLGIDFWRDLVSGKIDVVGAVQSLFKNARRATHSGEQNSRAGDSSYLERMEFGLAEFNRRVMLIVSGDDLTAAEFLNYTDGSKTWQQLLRRPAFTRKNIPEANHTFSSANWRRQVEEWTLDWVNND